MDEKRNTGHRNTGHWNTGHRNTGDRNTGHWNTGDRNTGHWNTGHWNTGHWNTGSWNTGSWNTGDDNTGFFCTETPKPTFFDLPCDLTWEQARNAIPFVDLPVGCEWVSSENMSEEEKSANPNHVTIGGYLKVLEKDIRVAFPIAWAKLDDATKKRFLDLPNFDAEKFLAITGVDVRKPDAPQEVIVDGRRYVLAE